MLDEKGVLRIDSTLDNSELSKVVDFLKQNLSIVKKVDVNFQKGLASSALFALLVSIKKSNKDIIIEKIIEDQFVNIEGLEDVKVVMRED